MGSKQGVIALMGSGEFTASMVEVHKGLLHRFPTPPRAVFLDTPAGFESNVDGISQRAVEYFRKQVGRELAVVSYKGKGRHSPLESGKAYHQLSRADYILMGPGSPTYALRQWKDTPIPEIFVQRILSGGCLAAASAAALTLGPFTLPVYEIYKVGEELHWVEGLHLLDRFGFPLVVIPHWNNAEGGTHDTRFCFMGKDRMERLESALPEGVGILGVDEHTACILDLEPMVAEVRGVGGVTLRKDGREIFFPAGERFDLSGLRLEKQGALHPSPEERLGPAWSPERGAFDFHERLERIQREIESLWSGPEAPGPQKVFPLLWELEELTGKGLSEGVDRENLLRTRELSVRLFSVLNMAIASMPDSRVPDLDLLLKELLAIRERFRREKRYPEADALRQALERAGIVVEDTAEGPRWRLRN